MYHGHLETDQKCPDYRDVLIFQVIFMTNCRLGPQLSVWIMQASLFSSVHINRFHCTYYHLPLVNVHIFKKELKLRTSPMHADFVGYKPIHA